MSKRRKGDLLIFTGLLLVAAALFLTGYNLLENRRAQRNVDKVTEKIQEITVEVQPEYVINTDIELPVEENDGMKYVGVLKMPTLQLELPVLSEWSGNGRKLSPCRYTGTPYTENMVLAAHNYKAHFQNLRNLKQGDLIIFQDMAGNVFEYTVDCTEILQPTDVEEMTESPWPLTMFTCTYDVQEHVTVRCSKVQ